VRVRQLICDIEDNRKQKIRQSTKCFMVIHNFDIIIIKVRADAKGDRKSLPFRSLGRRELYPDAISFVRSLAKFINRGRAMHFSVKTPDHGSCSCGSAMKQQPLIASSMIDIPAETTY
jgi:hypothetical protein